MEERIAHTFKRKRTKLIAFQFEYDEQIVEDIKKIPGRKWNSIEYIWEVPINKTTLEWIDIFCEHYNFSMDDELIKLIEKNYIDQQKNIELSNSLQTDLKIEGLSHELYPYQLTGVDYALKNKKFFIGDEQGLGKSVQAIATFHHVNAYPVIIICNNTLKWIWNSEIQKWLSHIKQEQISVIDTVKKQYDFSKKITILNYENAFKFKAELKKIKARCLIIDESQKLKTRTSQRTKAVFHIKGSMEYILMLSGTAILNKPIEFVPQLEILDGLKHFGNAWNFKMRYCGAKEGYFGWDFSGASNLDELHEKLKSLGCYIRRNKKDVLPDLPEKQFTNIFVDITNRKEYNKIENDLVSHLTSEFKKENHELSLQEKRKEILKIYKSVRKSEQLMKISQLRKSVIKGKMKFIIQWISDFLETGEKVVVFAYHQHTLEELQEKFNCGIIYGKTDPEDRQKIVDDFQNNPDTKLIVLNTDSGKEGLTLTAASNMATIEWSWRPGDHDQANDRIHRIGQKSACNYYQFIAKNTIEIDMYNLIEDKRKITTKALTGKDYVPKYIE